MPPREQPVVHEDEEIAPAPTAKNGGGSDMRRVVSQATISDCETEGITEPQYRVRRSNLIQMINWTHVLLTHAPQMMAFGCLVLVAQLVHQVVTQLGLMNDMEWSLETVYAVVNELQVLFLKLYEHLHYRSGDVLALLSPAVKITALVLIFLFWVMHRQNPIYMMSFATFKAPDSWKVTHDEVIEIMRRKGCFTEESLQFSKKILDRSGTGQATAWPPGIVQSLKPNTKSDVSIEGARKEAEAVIFDIVQQALDKANVKPREIDALIINCSLFSPTPSLCAMVLSHFGMRSDVATYNLSGMGCSASLISIELAKQLLGSNSTKHRKALVVSTEILTPNFYHGNDRGFLIQNTLFRCGGAAIVLSNSWLDGRRAWYKLLHAVRVQGTGQAAYDAVYETEDEIGQKGVRLSKDIVKVAGKCMEKNFTMLAPSVLPLTEQILVVLSIVARLFLKMLTNFLNNNGRKDLALKLPVMKPYVPIFKRGIDHFCIHAGGRAVIDGIEKNMSLEPYHVEPSRMTLYNYGNTSSSSIWYELEYIQEHQKTNTLKKGDRVLQVAFGSGFKCTSGVWLKL